MTAAKRPREEDDGSESSEGRQMRTTTSSFTLTTVAREALLGISLQGMLVEIERMLRRVVHEEFERLPVELTSRSFQRSPRIQIQGLQPTTLQLRFCKKLSLPIFTGTKIEGEDKNPLQISITETSPVNNHLMAPLPTSMRLEIVAIDGDFPVAAATDDECGNWSSEEFDSKIIKERQGKRPLVTGDVSVILRDGWCSIGDVMFTDNSSWTRSRQFRIAARVCRESWHGLRIREAITEPFMVKDHRGEVYRKHFPPSLADDVWRLSKIKKDGSFHRKLAEEGIKTVQDLLKLHAVDPLHLRRILSTMSDKMWETTLNHAKTCVMNRKIYLKRTPRCTVVLDPICRIQGIIIDGLSFSPHNLDGSQMDFVDVLVKEAYMHWNELEEVNDDGNMESEMYPGNGLKNNINGSSELDTSWFQTTAMVLPASEVYYNTPNDSSPSNNYGLH